MIRILPLPLAGGAGNTGAAAITLGALTATATGTVAIAGASSVTLGALTSSATGAVAIAGTGSITLGALTTAATGAVSITASAAITLDTLTVAATGAGPISGTAAVALDALAVTAVGTSATDVVGAADITLGGLTASGAGALAIAGAVAATLGALTVVAEGGTPRTGSASITLGSLTVSARGGNVRRDFRPREGMVLAMVAYPFDVAIETRIPGPPFPIGLLPGEDYFSYALPGGTRTVVSATDGFTSRPTDTPAHKWFPPLLANAFSFTVSMFVGIEPGASTRSAGPGNGEIEFTDPEGRLDAAVAMGWAGRVVEIWRGPPDRPFAEFTRVARLTSDGWTGLTEDGKSLRLRDNQARLYSTPLVATTYAGTGGIDGDAGVKGRLKLQSYGYVFNVEPALIDTANLIYQWHDREVHAVLAVLVGGVPWDSVGDVATYTALVALTMTNGQYATCNVLGIFRVGALPNYPIRVEGQGDVLDGVYALTRGQIVRRIATSRGMLPVLPSETDTASFAALDIAQPAECGWHFNGAVNSGDALDAIMQGVAGWWDIGLDGRLKVQQLEEPDEVADLVIDCDTALLADKPSREDDSPPRARTRTGWRANYAPQDASQLALEATSEDQQLYGEPARFGEREQSGVRVLYPTATEPAIASNYRYAVDADDEAVRQQRIFGKKRERWSFPISIDPFADVRGITVEVRNWRRYGFGTSKKMRVVGITSGVDGVTATLSLWG